jgi:hypothetical protein
MQKVLSPCPENNGCPIDSDHGNMFSCIFMHCGINFETTKVDETVKSPSAVIPDLIRDPEVVEKKRFPNTYLCREMTKNCDF